MLDIDILTTTSISLFLNDPTIKTYFTVIINICGNFLCHKKGICIITQTAYFSMKEYNTKVEKKNNNNNKFYNVYILIV